MSPAMSAVFPLLLLTFWGRSSAAEPFCQFSGSDDASLLQAHASTSASAAWVNIGASIIAYILVWGFFIISIV